MSDLISRKFLLKSIDHIADIGGIWGRAFTAYKEAFKEFVEGMPPAHRWITVSERLPEDTVSENEDFTETVTTSNYIMFQKTSRMVFSLPIKGGDA